VAWLTAHSCSSSPGLPCHDLSHRHPARRTASQIALSHSQVAWEEQTQFPMSGLAWSRVFPGVDYEQLRGELEWNQNLINLLIHTIGTLWNLVNNHKIRAEMNAGNYYWLTLEINVCSKDGCKLLLCTMLFLTEEMFFTIMEPQVIVRIVVMVVP